MVKGPDSDKSPSKQLAGRNRGRASDSLQVELWDTLRRVAPEAISTDFRVTLRRLVGISPELVVRYSTGRKMTLPNVEQTAAALQELYGRSNDHAADSVSFIREAFRICRQQLRGAHAAEALRLMVNISAKTVSSEGEGNSKNNLRKLRTLRTLEILAAVKAEEPARLLESLRIMSKYDGDLEALGSYLKKAGTNNPFRATRETPFILMSLYDLDPGLQSEIVTMHRRDPSGKLVPFAGRGDAGNFLIEDGELYFAFNQNLAFVSKRQAMLSIYRNWRSQEFSAEAVATRTSKRKQLEKAVARQVSAGEFDPVSFKELVDSAESARFGNALSKLENVSLEELLSNKAYQAIAKTSPTLARELQLFRELKAEIDKLMSARYRLLLGEDLLHPPGSISRILSEPAGKLFSRIERRMQEEVVGIGHVPEYVKLAYKRLRDPEQILSEKQELFYTQGILAWDAQQTCLTTRAVFGGLMKDLDLYREARTVRSTLPSNHPIHRVTTDFDRVAEELRDTLSTTEISVSQATYAIDRLGVLGEWREAMNRYQYAPYAGTFNDSVEKLRWLFQDEVTLDSGDRTVHIWKQDCTGASIPMERLRKSIYGAPVTVEGQPALIQRDFKFEMQALSLMEFNRRENDLTFFQAMSIADFREMVLGVTRAARKADALDIAFHEARLELQAGQNRADVGGLFVEKKLQTLVGGLSNATRLLPAEEIFLGDGASELAQNSTATETLREIVRRARARFSGGAAGHATFLAWREVENDLIATARVGLYPEPIRLVKGDAEVGAPDQHISGRTKRIIKELQREFETLVPVSEETRKEIEFAATLLRSPAVELGEEQRRNLSRAEAQQGRIKKPGLSDYSLWCDSSGYLTQSELELIKTVFEFKPTFESLKLEKSDSLSELMLKTARYRSLRVHRLENADHGRFNLAVRTFDRDTFGLKQECGLKYYDPGALTSFVAMFEGPAAKFLTDKQVETEFGAHFLRRAGVLVSSSSQPSWASFGSHFSEEIGRIGRDDVQLLQDVLEARERSTTQLNDRKRAVTSGDPIGRTNSFIWGNAHGTKELEPRINFGTAHKGKSLFEVPVTYLEWCLSPERKWGSREREIRFVIEKYLVGDRTPKSQVKRRQDIRKGFLDWLKGWEGLPG